MVTVYPPFEQTLIESLRGADEFSNFSSALQLRWRHAYLLDVPVFKFSLWQLSTVSLGIFLTFSPAARDMEGATSESHFLLLYTWVTSALLSEISQFFPAFPMLRHVDGRGGGNSASASQVRSAADPASARLWLQRLGSAVVKTPRNNAVVKTPLN